MKILLVEHDHQLLSSIQRLLLGNGFQVEAISDADTGWDFAMLGAYDLLILDIGTSGITGHMLTRQVRANRCTVPVIILTHKNSVEERVESLNSGADFCLGIPFDNRELLACTNAVLRRQGTQLDNLSYGNTELDLATCTLRCGDKKVRLTAKEFEVLRQLMRNGERIIPKETLLARVWGFDTNAVDNHVEVYMAFLRKKLRSIGSNIEITAIRRMGYHLELKDE